MLPKATRLPRKSFVELSAGRKSFHTAHFTLQAAPAQLNLPRIGVTVSKKVSRSAVVRNRTRRRVYAAIESLIGSLAPQLYLIIVRPGTDKLDSRAIALELADLFKKSYNH